MRARDFGEPLVPVRIQLDSPLLHHNPGEVLPGIKSKTAVVEAHGRPLFTLIKDVNNVCELTLIDQSGIQTHGQIFLQAQVQIALPLRCQHKVKGAHLAAIVCSAADPAIGAGKHLRYPGGRSAGKRNRLSGSQRLLHALKVRGITAFNGRKLKRTQPTCLRSAIRPESKYFVLAVAAVLRARPRRCCLTSV